MSPVGGLSHQGKLDPDQPTEKSKQSRTGDSKRRTVQVEYVPPQSETVRGEATPSAKSAAAVESPSAVGTSSAKSRTRAGNSALEEALRPSTITKPLPQEPATIQTTSSRYQYQPGNTNIKANFDSIQSMAPPARPSKDIPRSASDAPGAFGYSSVTTMPRPNTSGSMTSGGQGRLPSRGNSYSQPLAPTVAVTNAQGKLAQPKNGKQYIISAPIPQTEPYYEEQSVGRPSTQQNYHASGIASPRVHAKSHKRSNTLGGVFSRSGSFFGSKPQAPPSQDQPKQTQEKRYPPPSMKNPIASDSPRQSMESRRSTSFGFGRKSSDIKKNSELPRQEKPRRFSLLPASFSLKNITGTSKDRSDDAIRPTSQRRPSIVTQQAPPSRGQARPQTMGASRGQSQTNIYQREDAVSSGYDGQRERNRGNITQQAGRGNVPYQATPNAQASAYDNHQYPDQPESYGPPRRLLGPGQSYLLGKSGTPTDSEASLAASQHRPVYPAGFSSYEDEPRPSMQQNRTARVLQKNNRKFGDAYEQDQEPGYGNGGHHAGSSGAAKRVMDFFRRRGKARAGEDRV